MKKLFDQIGNAEIRNIIAIISVLGCFALLFLMQFKEIPNGNQSIINIAIGFIFGGLLTGVAGYYFGASKKDKIE